MLHNHKVAVIIPARNEADALPHVLSDIPSWVDQVIIADNGSTDGTAKIAASSGATVVSESREGYGYACMAGIDAAPEADILVFLDGDRSDFPEQMNRLAMPIAHGKTDMVIGSRALGTRERGALTPQQRYGNALACTLIWRIWGHLYTDLGPFRAIRREALIALNMREMTYGWTVEMQIRAIEHGLRIREAPVDYRRRIGISKVSGTVRGVLGAGSKILSCIFRSAWRDWRHSMNAPSERSDLPQKAGFPGGKND